MPAALCLNDKLPAPYRTSVPMLIGAVASAGILIFPSVVGGRGVFSNL